MAANEITLRDWVFPGCPQPRDWELGWDALLARYPWLLDLAHTPQEPRYHGEGDVLTHTGMVVAALVALPAWRALGAVARSALFAAALLHDVAKPRCTIIDDAGRIRSPGHARAGAHMARTLLWRDALRYGKLPFILREQVAALVYYHGLPLWFLDKPDPARAVVAASQTVRLDAVALLAEADVRGRICDDGAELLARIDLFRQFCAELGCLDRPYPFASDHARVVYFRNPQAALHYAAYDDTRFEVLLLSGLPATGKDTWVQQHASHLPVVGLDALREALDVDPTEPQGQVIAAAKEQARVLLRRGEPFVWNATNITRQLRGPLLSLFSDYGARLRIVYLDAPFDTILERNRGRANPVPEAVIERLLAKVEPPDLTEAHTVEYMTADTLTR
jgi:predicted kinase